MQDTTDPGIPALDVRVGILEQAVAAIKKAFGDLEKRVGRLEVRVASASFVGATLAAAFAKALEHLFK